jgi:hypothetical protein
MELWIISVGTLHVFRQSPIEEVGVEPLAASTIHQTGQVQANGITIAYESFGNAHPR